MASVTIVASERMPRSGAKRDLRAALRRSERRRGLRAAALLAPLAIFMLLCFFAPIALLLARGFTDREVSEAWPATAAALREWSGASVPDARLVATFIEELKMSQRQGTMLAAANRLNHGLPGSRTLLMRTADALAALNRTVSVDELVAIDARWAQPDIWAVMRQAAGPLTSFYILAAVDLHLDAEDRLRAAPSAQGVFISVFARTFWISAVVAALCALLGYPVAYVLSSLPERLAHPLLVLVLLPFWTSVLVRTTAWMVLLQDQGLVNGMLLDLGLLSEPLQLIYNRAGVYVALTHVLLPYFVLPLYAVMKRISPVTTRAALSLGATPAQAFWRVYFVQTLPGAAAGALTVFVLALGYYITPALVGGAGDQMISYFIAFFTNQSLNWGMAAALSVLLLVTTSVLLAFCNRLAGRRELALRA
jgi:putative spermidine/putrescine transport system permease protein